MQEPTHIVLPETCRKGSADCSVLNDHKRYGQWGQVICWIMRADSGRWAFLWFVPGAGVEFFSKEQEWNKIKEREPTIDFQDLRNRNKKERVQEWSEVESWNNDQIQRRAEQDSIRQERLDETNQPTECSAEDKAFDVWGWDDRLQTILIKQRLPPFQPSLKPIKKQPWLLCEEQWAV